MNTNKKGLALLLVLLICVSCAPLTSFAAAVPGDTWYSPVLDWALENGYIQGLSEADFTPNAQASEAMIATALAKLAEADLATYADAAAWAKEINLLGDRAFQAETPVSRGDIALMLIRLIDYLGLQFPLTREFLIFADAETMTQEENAAFQTLYKLGIFAGRGDMEMDPRSLTTCVELLALLHRFEGLQERYTQ